MITVLALAAGCGESGRGSGSQARGAAGPATASPAGDPARRAADLAARLGDEDLVGQVLVPYAFGSGATTVSPGSAQANRRIGGVDTPAEMIRRYRLGGLILVRFSADDPTAGTNATSNLDSPEQIRELTTGLQAAARKLPAGVPLLVGTDQEYGVIRRVDSIVQLPSAMAFGASGDPALTRRAWAAAGGDLAALGITVDFAPDADVLGPGGSGTVIGSRAYGSDPVKVAAQVDAAVRGLADAGVVAVPKHFPGHGRATADSHNTLPLLTQSAPDLSRADLPPFVAGIGAGAPMIMSGHLDVRAIDPGVPASFSSKVLIDLLRHKLGFTGVVVTDALNMEPARRWPAGEAAVRAMLAGNDLLLMPPDLAAARQGLLDALHSGRLPRSRLVEAVTRILTVKLRTGNRPQPPLSSIDDAGDRDAASAAATGAVTVLRGGCTGPLVSGPVTVTTSKGRDRQRDWLTGALRSLGVPIGPGGTVVHLVGYGDGAADLSRTATVTVAMDTPDILASVPSGALLATYSSTEASMRALAAVLAGRARAPGRSPVAVRGLPASACAR